MENIEEKVSSVPAIRRVFDVDSMESCLSSLLKYFVRIQEERKEAQMGFRSFCRCCRPNLYQCRYSRSPSSFTGEYEMRLKTEFPNWLKYSRCWYFRSLSLFTGESEMRLKTEIPNWSNYSRCVYLTYPSLFMDESEMSLKKEWPDWLSYSLYGYSGTNNDCKGICHSPNTKYTNIKLESGISTYYKLRKIQKDFKRNDELYNFRFPGGVKSSYEFYSRNWRDM